MPASATQTDAVAVTPAYPWLFWMLAALLAVAILMLASWLLRQWLPVGPDTRVTVLPAPPTTVPPPPPPVDQPSQIE